MNDKKYVLIYDPAAPFDGVRPDTAALAALSKDFTVINFDSALPEDTDVLVNLHGAYFPIEMYADIRCAIRRGMGFISAGIAAPLKNPCIKENGVWRAQRPQTAYYTPFMIENCISVPKGRYQKTEINPDMPVLAGYEGAFAVRDTQSYIVQFTHADDQPGTCGSSGPIDAMIFPLVRGFLCERHMASPVVAIDYYRGEMAGCRHIFLNFAPDAEFWCNGGTSVLARLADYSAFGSYTFMLAPNYATYYENERPTLRLTSQHYTRETTGEVKISVRYGDENIYEKILALRFGKDVKYTDIVLPIDIKPGYYTVAAELSFPDGGDGGHIYHNAFWGRDEGLLAQAPHITADENYLRIDGKPMPVVGMTYMQSDLHRKFVFMPNPYIWDKDFHDMQDAGINMVRTGVWTGYREVMYIDNVPNEISLRAFEAMVHTACRYKMPLVLCLFSFIPPLWEGKNGYLDPDSLRAQRRYVAAFLEKTHNCPLVSWDLINEPSVDNPDALWSSRPNGDSFELAAWHDYLAEKHGTIEALRENWNYSTVQAASIDSLGMPDELMFNDNPVNFPRVSLRPALDFHRFATEIFNSWAREMTDCIRGVGNDQLITVGQDEPFGGKKPDPLNIACTLDYVCNHSWWQMDAIYMDGVLAKPEHKPCLIQETGIMYTQTPDNFARRGFEECRNILERKYALAYGSGCAGAVHWVWNTNNYMDNINEAHIGAATSCGAQKAEADVSYDFGDFIRATSRYFNGKLPERVAFVVPFSNLYSCRNKAAELCNAASRALGYELHVPFQALSEYELKNASDYDIVIVPAAGILCDEAFEALCAMAERGTAVIASGVFYKDEYYKVRSERFAAWGFDEMSETSAQREEKLELGDKRFYLSYGGDGLASADKVLCGPKNAVAVHNIGKGKLIWLNLPAETGGFAVDFYRYALEKCGFNLPITQLSDAKGIFINRQRFSSSSLYIVVNESGSDEIVELRDNESGFSYSLCVLSGRAALFMCSSDGKLLKSYRDIPVSIK